MLVFHWWREWRKEARRRYQPNSYFQFNDLPTSKGIKIRCRQFWPAHFLTRRGHVQWGLTSKFNSARSPPVDERGGISEGKKEVERGGAERKRWPDDRISNVWLETCFFAFEKGDGNVDKLTRSCGNGYSPRVLVVCVKAVTSALRKT